MLYSELAARVSYPLLSEILKDVKKNANMTERFQSRLEDLLINSIIY